MNKSICVLYEWFSANKFRVVFYSFKLCINVFSIARVRVLLLVFLSVPSLSDKTNVQRLFS